MSTWFFALAALLVILACVAYVSVLAARDTLAAAEHWDCGDDADDLNDDPADWHFWTEPEPWPVWDYEERGRS